MKVVTAEQMRHIDRACIKQGTPESVLMENAGRAVAEAARDHIGDVAGKYIVCLVGGGNNGGDALVSARYFHDWDAHVSVCLCSQRREDDENLRLLREREIECLDTAAEGPVEALARISGADFIIDGLLGTGRMRPLEGLYREIMSAVKKAREERSVIVVAVDLPTGMDADTGTCDPSCAPADLTVTLALPKPGLFGVPGAEYTGKLVIADIGIPEELAATSNTELMDDSFVRGLLPKRPLLSNKGTFGKLMVIAGSVNYTGAASLACRGALRAGTGLVTLAAPASLHPVLAAGVAEATHLLLPESPAGHIASNAVEAIYSNCSGYDAILLGCGLGRNPSTAEFVRALLANCPETPVVLDADALNILSESPNWYETFRKETVITPHPGEMSRLAGIPIGEIQTDRLEAARKHATRWNKTIILKGAYTVIAAPDGRCRISPFANPGLASGGTGDVLAGITGGLLAQGMGMFDAASLGVYLHGLAGDAVRKKLGETGMLASDLFTEIPLAIRHLKETKL